VWKSLAQAPFIGVVLPAEKNDVLRSLGISVAGDKKRRFTRFCLQSARKEEKKKGFAYCSAKEASCERTRKKRWPMCSGALRGGVVSTDRPDGKALNVRGKRRERVPHSRIHSVLCSVKRAQLKNLWIADLHPLQGWCLHSWRASETKQIFGPTFASDMLFFTRHTLSSVAESLSTSAFFF